MDWLHFSRDVQEVMSTYWATIDTMLMGRKTWEVATAMGGAGGGGMQGITTYVFSRTLDERGPRRASRQRGSRASSCAQLKEQPGKGICVMGGGELAQSLFAAGVIDEVGHERPPDPARVGRSVLSRSRSSNPLELAESRVIDGGCVLMTYRVKPAGTGGQRKAEARRKRVRSQAA